MTPEPNSDALSLIFYAASHERRRSVLNHLQAYGPRTVRELENELFTDQPVLSKHLAALDAAGLVDRRASGRFTVNSVAQNGAAATCAWFESLFQGCDDYRDVNLRDDEKDRIFNALEAPWARSTLMLLARGPAVPAQTIQKHIQVSQPETSRRLRRLRAASLVNVESQGPSRFYSIRYEVLWSAWGWLANYG